jgi:hypothetical protein
MIQVYRFIDKISSKEVDLRYFKDKDNAIKIYEIHMALKTSLSEP